MSSIITLRQAVLGGILLCGVGAVAIADSKIVPSRVAVEYGDLDLSQVDGAETLYKRITTAARRTCGEATRGSLNQLSRFKQCYQTAVANAVNEVDAKTLTAVHLSKKQRPTAS